MCPPDKNSEKFLLNKKKLATKYENAHTHILYTSNAWCIVKHKTISKFSSFLLYFVNCSL